MVRAHLQARPHFRDVPLLGDVLPERQRPLLALLEAPDNFSLPLVGPAGIPPERADILPARVSRHGGRSDYQSDARKAEQPVGEPIGGAQLSAMVEELAKSATPDIVAAYRQLTSTK